MFTLSANKVKTFFIVCLVFIAGCSSQPDLIWNEENGTRWAELTTDFWGGTGFSPLSLSETKIGFRNDVREELKQENRHYLNGSGVAVADVDGDGTLSAFAPLLISSLISSSLLSLPLSCAADIALSATCPTTTTCPLCCDLLHLEGRTKHTMAVWACG